MLTDYAPPTIHNNGQKSITISHHEHVALVWAKMCNTNGILTTLVVFTVGGGATLEACGRVQRV